MATGNVIYVVATNGEKEAFSGYYILVSWDGRSAGSQIAIANLDFVRHFQFQLEVCKLFPVVLVVWES